MDIIRIKNTGTKPLVLRHDVFGDVSIPRGKSRVLQAAYAYIHFGHPAARNIGRQKDRDTEYTMARTMWGFYPGLMPEAAWEGVATTNDGETVGPFCPQFECYDMEDNRVYMVLDDRDGSLAAAHGGVVSDEASDAVEANATAAHIASLNAQIAELRALILGQQHGVPGSGFEPPEDDDTDDEDTEDDGTAQAKRNEARDAIPKPPENEPPVTTDKPRTTRVGAKR